MPSLASALALASCALLPPVEARVPKVLIVGIDGLRPDALLAAQAPALHALLEGGAWTPRCSTDAHTISGAGWSDFLTGTWPDKHHSIDNKFAATSYGPYPHLFRRLKQLRPALKLAHFCSWLPIDEKILGELALEWRGAWDCEKDDGDAKVARAALEVLSEQDPDVVFAYFGDVDEVGHAHGFSPYVPEYLAEIADTDAKVGQLLAAMKARKSYAREDWLVLVSSDHAGSIDGSHGRDEAAHRTILFAEWASARALPHGELIGTVNLVDLVPTALEHLGLAAERSWELDGRSWLAPPPATIGKNLIFNGGAEQAPGRSKPEQDLGLAGWRDWGALTALRYGSPQGCPTLQAAGPKARGENFFCGGTAQRAEIEQLVDLSALAREIDAGTLRFRLSGWLGGYAEQTDLAYLDASFLDAHGGELARVRVGPVTLADRRREIGGQGEALTGLLERAQLGELPPRARSVRLTLVSEAGSGANDGYADELELVLSAR